MLVGLTLALCFFSKYYRWDFVVELRSIKNLYTCGYFAFVENAMFAGIYSTALVESQNVQ
jgi:hypothetical protein